MLKIMLFLSMALAGDGAGWIGFASGVAGPPIALAGAVFTTAGIIGPPPPSARQPDWDPNEWQKSHRFALGFGIPTLLVGLTGTLAGPPLLLAQSKNDAALAGWGLWGGSLGMLGASITIHAISGEAPLSYWGVPILYYGSLVAGAVALTSEVQLPMLQVQGVF
jgi:hypothetical protein